MQRLMQRIFWDDYETDSDGIYSALNQIRQCLSGETTYTEMMPQIPEGEDPIRWFLTEGKQGNDVYYAAAATEAFRAYGIPARYVEGYYLSADQIQKEESGTNTLTGADAHAWVEVYFDGVGWLPLDTTPGYYYDAVSLQQMISAPDQVNRMRYWKIRHLKPIRRPILRDQEGTEMHSNVWLSAWEPLYWVVSRC